MISFRLGLIGFVLLSSAANSFAESKVGVIAGLSGDNAAYGRAYQDAIAMAQKDLPESRVKFIYEDDQFLPRLSVQAARKLISIDKVDVLIVGDTTTARAVSQSVPDTIPIYVWASEHPDFIKSNIIRSWPREAKELELMEKEVLKEGLANIAMLASSHDYTLTWSRGMRERLKERVVYYEEFTSDLDSFRSLLPKLKNLGAQSISLCLNNPKNGQLAREAADLRLDFKLFGCNFLQAGADHQAARGALKGAWYMDTPVTGTFKASYLKLTGSIDYLNAAAVMYDIAQVILLAAQKNLKTSELPKLSPVAGANGEFHIRDDAGFYFDYGFERVDIK
ncbi:MAG: hypothetical protein DCC75_08105 [Proteobacteria bacterium]|nr:MAG: hypothetical protein DCC75_08105 [Pseudomonadota bacterium]